jgi:hypothetical protein
MASGRVEYKGKVFKVTMKRFVFEILESLA